MNFPNTPARIGAELGVDPKTILATSHGRRSIDVMGLYDKTKANWDCTLSLPLTPARTIRPICLLTPF
jgi:hypothetical protein